MQPRLSARLFVPFLALLAAPLVACGGTTDGSSAAGSGGSASGSAGQSGAGSGGSAQAGSGQASSGHAGSGGSGGKGGSGGSAGAAGKVGGGGAQASTGGGAGSINAAGSAGGAGSPGAGGSGVQGGSGGGALAGSGGSGAFAGSSEGEGGSGQGGSGGSGGASGSGDACTTEAECSGFKTPPDQQAKPPASSGGGAVDGSAPLRHAFSRLLVGETQPDGTLDANAWKLYGFDLDGWNSTPKQGFHCKPAAGGKANDIRQDGNGGIDNSYSKNIVTNVLSGLIINPSESATQSITNGNGSMVLDLGKLGAKPSYTPVASRYIPVAGDKQNGNVVAPPAGDWSTYLWHPTSNGETDDQVLFEDAYLAGNIWASGSPRTLVMGTEMEGFSFPLRVHLARVVVDVSDRQNGKNGVIGGILYTEEFIEGMRKAAGSLSTQFCGNSTAFDGIATQIRQASDILVDGTQDPTKTCDGISFGMGFETKASGLGALVVIPKAPDPCAGN